MGWTPGRRAAAAVAAAVVASGLVVIGGTRGPAAVAGPAPVGGVSGYAASEQFNDTPVGAVPAGWGTDTSGGTVAVQPLPDQTDRSLRLLKPGAAGAVAAERRLTAPLAGVVHAEARVWVSGAAGWFNALYVAGSDGTPAASIAIRDGAFYDAGTGHVVAPAAPRRWYAVRVVLRPADQRFDLYVDGAKLLSGAPFRQSTPDVGRVAFGIGAGHTGTLHVDTVVVRREPDPTVTYLVADTFDAGVNPWTAPAAGRAEVAAVPSAADRSLLVTGGPTGDATVVRSFAPQTGRVTVQATVRTDETAGVKAALYVRGGDGKAAAAIRFNNGVLEAAFDSGTQELVRGVRAGEWYTIRVVLDVPAREFVVFVDGRRHPAVGTTGRPVRWPFRNPGVRDVGQLFMAAGNAGTLRADKVFVYPTPGTEPTGAVVDVRAHGAVGDGTTVDTAAIQAAVDAVPDGGTVLLSGGVFRSGTITLKSRMTLFVAPDAMLLGSGDPAAYPDLRATLRDRPPFNGGLVARALVFAHRADGVVIEGGGVINGNGLAPAWVTPPQTPERERPAGIYVARGAGITIRNVSLKYTPFSAIVPTEITGLTIADVDIEGDIPFPPGFPTTHGTSDGVDITDSDDVLVERLSATTDDDALCFKTHLTDSSPGSVSLGVERAVVRLSAVSSARANGVKLGTASHGAFRDITVEDTLVKNLPIGGLVITAVDGGEVGNVSFRRVTVDRVKRAIFVVIGRRVWVDPDTHEAHPARDPKWISGLRFEDVTATRLATGQPPNHLGNGAALSGTWEASTGRTYRIYDVLFSNVRLDLAAGGTATPVEPYEYDGAYPEAWTWTRLAAYGYFLRHVDGATLRNATAAVPDPNGRPARDTTRDVLNLWP